MKKITCTGLLLLFVLTVFGQKNRITALSDSLKRISVKMLQQEDDSLKLLYNIRYTQKLHELLNDPASFDFRFDSLRTMGIITSPDKAFRLYNWNIPLMDGSSRYFCLIQLHDKKKNTVFELKDASDSIADPERKILGKNNWYGALYYKIIPERVGNRTIYTLLGWDGHSHEKNRKIIEILSFDNQNNPVFGATIFRNFQKGRYTRIFFDYPAGSSFMLKFDEQKVVTGKKYNPSRRTTDPVEEKLPVIVVDHLVPVDTQKGAPVMAPSDLYDGFVFRNGTWNFVTGIDTRNP